MEYISGITSSGGSWTPTFVVRSNINDCGCCGKCFKICGRGCPKKNIVCEPKVGVG
jgi:hypothetical protein